MDKRTKSNKIKESEWNDGNDVYCANSRNDVSFLWDDWNERQDGSPQTSNNAEISSYVSQKT